MFEGHGDPYTDCCDFSDGEHEPAYPSTEDESFHSDDSNKDHSDDPTPAILKTPIKCKLCVGAGHNSRTCSLKVWLYLYSPRCLK